MTYLEQLQERTTELANLSDIASLLGWDMQTQMPPGAAGSRAEQQATISKVIHEKWTSDEMGSLISQAEQEVADKPDDSDEVRLVQVAKRDYEQSVKLPAEFVTEFTRTTSLAHQVWAKARSGNDFEQFRPTLEKIVDLCIQQAEYLGYEDHVYDALLDQYEPGMKSADVETVFEGLRADLVPFAQAIFEKADTVSDEPLHRHFPVDKQREFGIKIAEQMGYDLNRGRQDEAVHPFCSSFTQNDVRITTRFNPNFLSESMFSTWHEAGHAMYNQGVANNLAGTLLDSGASLGIHESQSRLWENIVGRSRGFWGHFYGDLQQTFAPTLDDVSLEDFYRAANKVEPSFIRVEADEVTYCLHIMLRFDLERDLLTGKLAVKDAPDAWNAKMESYLGIVPPTDTLGVLQDVHWSAGILGYFPTYALGTLLSAQLYDKAVAEHPEIPSEIASGKFSTLLSWMNENIHAPGRKFLPAELIERATGQPLSHKPYMNYLRTKFGEIYDV